MFFARIITKSAFGSRANFHTPEILYIILRNCYTSQGDPDSSFLYWLLIKFHTRNATRVTSKPLLCHSYCDVTAEIMESSPNYKLLPEIAGFMQVQQFLASLFIYNVKSDHLYVVRQTNDSNDTRLLNR